MEKSEKIISKVRVSTSGENVESPLLHSYKALDNFCDAIKQVSDKTLGLHPKVP